MTEKEMKLPPQNLEAEQAVLAAMWTDPNLAVPLVGRILTESSFHAAFHRAIYREVTKAFALTGDVDPVDVMTALKGKYENVYLYMKACADQCLSPNECEKYAGYVRDAQIKRGVIAEAGRMVAAANTEESVGSEVANAAAEALSDLGQIGTTGGYKHIGAIMRGYVDKVEERRANPGKEYDLQTGFVDIDRLIGGLRPGTLNVLAAKPGLGKTSLALQMAWNAAFHDNKTVAFCSLEMLDEQLVARLASHFTKINIRKMETGNVAEHEMGYLRGALFAAENISMHIDDEGDQTTADMMSRARNLAVRNTPDLIVVDYLQMAKPKRKTESTAYDLDAVSYGLVEMAKRFNCPVLAVAALKRSDNERPRMNELRASGGIEYAAHLIMLMHRAENDETGLTEVNIAKNRSGPTGLINLQFIPELTMYGNAERESDHYANRI